MVHKWKFFVPNFLLFSFLSNLERKHFGGLGEKTPRPHQFSLLKSLQSNTHKNYFLFTFLSLLKSPHPNRPYVSIWLRDEK